MHLLPHTAHLKPLLCLLLVLATTPSTAASDRPPGKNAILLSTVESLTLRAGQQTTHRRVSPIPQLQCISHPNICRLHEPQVVRCTNQGAGYGKEDIQWSCTASLPPELKLGATDVACEGYRHADDDWILKGSCGLSYRLVLTDEGERKFPDLADGRGGTRGRGSDWGAYIFIVIFVAVLAWIVISACYAAEQNRRGPPGPRRPRPRGPGGDWGGGGWDDPPPPYPGTKSSQQERWRPGFWTGLGSGAAAGYFAGSRANRPQQHRDYGTRWGSSNAGSSTSSSGSVSSSRYESTGFGGTSRR